MKTIDALRNLGFISKANTNDIKPLSVPENSNEFSFSPNKNREVQSDLADFLSFKPNSQTIENPLQIPKKSTTPKPKSFNKSPNPDVQKSFTRTKSPNLSMTFRPEINPTSKKILKIAAKEGRDLHMKRSDKVNPQPNPVETKNRGKNGQLKEFLNRNYTQELIKVGAKRNCTPVMPLDKVDEECTFRPFLDEKSREMTGNNRLGLYELGLRKIAEKEYNIKAALEKKEKEDSKNCTFTPKILKKTQKFEKKDSKTITNRTLYAKKHHRAMSPLTIETESFLDYSS